MKPEANQTPSEKAHVKAVIDNATSSALALLFSERVSSLTSCESNLTALRFRVMQLERAVLSHNFHMARSPNLHAILETFRNSEHEQSMLKNICELSAGNSMYGRCQMVRREISVPVSMKKGLANSHLHHQQQILSECLPKYQQPWVLVASRSQHKMVGNSENGCEHVGGDSEQDYTLEQCFDKAARAGANVINYGAFTYHVGEQQQDQQQQDQEDLVQTSNSSSAVFNYKDLVTLENNFSKARFFNEFFMKHFLFGSNIATNNNASAQEEMNLHLMQKMEEYYVPKNLWRFKKSSSGGATTSSTDPHELSHAERAKLARKRRLEAAKRAKVAVPSTTTTSSGYYDYYNLYGSSPKKKSSSLTGKGCYYKKCSAVDVLKEDVPLVATNETSGDFYVFVKNMFFVNATGSHSLLL